MNLRRWAPAVAWGALVLVLTSLPASTLPQAPYFPGADKVVHAALYAVFGALTGRALSPRRPRSLLIAFAALAIFAALDEWHQNFVPGRYQDRADWLADMLGGAAGLSLAFMTLRRREHVT